MPWYALFLERSSRWDVNSGLDRMRRVMARNVTREGGKISKTVELVSVAQ